MKHDAWRRRPSSYPVLGELAPRVTDVDLWQHLNNAALISTHGEACQRWLGEVLGAEVWRQNDPMISMLANVTDFLAEAHYPEPLVTGVRLLGVDAAGFRLGSALFQHHHCVGLHQATLAQWVDGRPVPLSAAVADTLHAHAAQQPAPPEPDHTAAHEPLPGPIPRSEDFPWHIALDSRFGDSDARGQTSDASLARYAEQTRAQFLTQVFGVQRLDSATGFMVGHVALRWLQRGRPPAAWRVGCGVVRVGDRSMAVRSALFDGDACRAVCETVMVAIDRASRRSTAMPEAARALLAPYRLPVALPD